MKLPLYIELNLWSFVALAASFFSYFLGAVIPGEYRSWFSLIPFLGLGTYLAVLALQLFSSTNTKIRSYGILMGRNKSIFHADSFGIYMKAPCGRVLVRRVLRDLELRGRYSELKMLKIEVPAGLIIIPPEQKTYPFPFPD